MRLQIAGRKQQEPDLWLCTQLLFTVFIIDSYQPNAEENKNEERQVLLLYDHHPTAFALPKKFIKPVMELET